MSQEVSLKQGRAELLLAAEVSAIFTAGAYMSTTPQYLNPATAESDSRYYVKIAAGEACETSAWCVRVLEPTLVRFLPGDILTGFQIMTLFSVFTSSVLLFAVTRELGFSIQESLVGIVMFFTLGTAITGPMYRPYYVDSFAYVFILAGILCALRERLVPFVVVVTVGLLAHERLLFIVPLYYTLNTAELIDVDLLKKTVVLGIVLSVGYILMSYVLTTSTGGFKLVDGLSRVLGERLTDLQTGTPIAETTIGTLNRYVFVPHKLLILLAVLKIRETLDLIIRFSPYVVAIHMTLLLATGYERYLVYLFPVLVPAALHGLRHIHTEMSMIYPNLDFPFAVHAVPFVIIIVASYIIGFPTIGLDYRYHILVFLGYTILGSIALLGTKRINRLLIAR